MFLFYFLWMKLFVELDVVVLNVFLMNVNVGDYVVSG